MKKILLIVLSLTISNLSYAKDSDLYLAKLNQCDENLKIALENDLTNGVKKQLIITL